MTDVILPVSIGITAHNEAGNIGRLLDRLSYQELNSVKISEIIVVSSGSTDATDDIVREWEVRNPLVRLVVQSRREGKASAINLLLTQIEEKIVVLSSADVLPEPTTIERLVTPMHDESVGMVGVRPVPVNDPNQLMGYAAHLLWDLHHDMNMAGTRKVGEMVAFRHVFERIPNHTAVDEASIEPLIRGQGYSIAYAPDAIVYNKGPETVGDFLRQRRRIFAGHLEMQQELGYAVGTMNGGGILPHFIKRLEPHPKKVVWAGMVAGLEVFGRKLGQRDFRRQRNHTVWDVATTTKQLE